ncbi:MAG: putative zinc-binding metallopeptidase [Bacteroidota bacterium]
MKIFQCGHCNNPVFFENTLCEVCGHWLGYWDDEFDMFALDPEETTWQIFSDRPDRYQYCGNFAYNACNWLLPVNDSHHLCTACQVNRAIPDLSDQENLTKWQRLESAKHLLIYSLQRFELPVQNKIDNPTTGLAFDFLSNKYFEDEDKPIPTGHANGVITLNIDEADSTYRERLRKQMNEPYRTLIGHFRHEIGHYYWDILIRDHPDKLASFRQYFGDERLNYGDALKKILRRRSARILAK